MVIFHGYVNVYERVMTILGLIDSHHDQSVAWLLILGTYRISGDCTTDPSPSANFAHIFASTWTPQHVPWIGLMDTHLQEIMVLTIK